MHLDSTCTGLSSVAINGIKELGSNVMLFCNKCVQNNERDKFIRNGTAANMKESVDLESIQDSLKTMEARISNLVGDKVEQAFKSTCKKMEKSYSKVVATNIPKGTNQVKSKKEAQYGIEHNVAKSFRIQGIKEDPGKTRQENLVPASEEVLQVLNDIGVKQPQMQEIKRLGKFDKERKNPRTPLVTVVTEYEPRLVLAKSVEKRLELIERGIFITTALSKEDARKENLCLKKRRQLLDEGVPKKN